MHACIFVVGENVEAQLQPFTDEFAFDERPEDVPRKPGEKYDYYQIGGRWKHLLPLRVPRQKRWLFGLFNKTVTHTHTAFKSEVLEASQLKNPPVSVLMDGVWEDAEIVIGQPTMAQWHQRFEQLFCSLPESARLTLVDYHT